ncbi:ATP-binding protein [Sphingomonas sp. BN140010]|uniref:histidine kinase n=1 Tax=Sphingomonas arvum TaxID=2992113 RepID=A0ABT3JB88_9SPHN|nr:ATP-binding protein [Sphingomonas sp. BN140010]MCW3796326.1 ATP-binding protein [Sphingomonas sp. BN140010]
MFFAERGGAMNLQSTLPPGEPNAERLKELEERLSISLAAAGAVGSWDWDILNRRVYFDARLANFQGITALDAAKGLPAKDFFSAIHPDDAPRIRVAVSGMLHGAEVFFKSYRMIAPDGSLRWVEAHGRCSFGEHEQPERFSGILVDITARQRVEERLRIAQTAGGVGTFEYVQGFPTATVSEQFCQLLGLDPSPVVPIATINALVVDGSRPLLESRPVRTLGSHEYAIRRADTGELRWIARRGELLPEAEGAARQIGVIFDISDLKQTQQQLNELNRNLESRVQEEIQSRQRVEERLRQAQKMEAIGQLTGGIAHDFNNLLTVIIGNVDMARRRLGAASDERVERALANALKSSERAASLTQRLLAFSRRQPLEPTALDVARLVQGMFDLLNRSIGEQIELRTDFQADLWTIEADANQLESAILNMAVNARDAMDHRGTLLIQAENVSLQEAEETGSLASGDYVRLVVSDTGCGMPAEVIERAFDPFFTTKEVGKGTGLGLSMVFGFVRQSGGDVRISSLPGAGTSMELLLPRSLHAVQSAANMLARDVAASRRSGTILVVEDDDDVRLFASEGLRDLGYEVLQASGGAEALTVLGERGGQVDLLLTDVVMPGMTGRELVQQAIRLNPEVKVLHMSGYPGEVITSGGRIEDGVALLSKPFTLQALAARVEEMLARDGG